MNETLDWTRGGTVVHYQQCPSCHHLWYFERDFCPACGHTAPTAQQASGLGGGHASTLMLCCCSDINPGNTTLQCLIHRYSSKFL